MSWHGIHGHDDVVEQFRRALARRRLASSFLFAGPAGVGKRAFAAKLAQAMLCQTRPEEALDPCGEFRWLQIGREADTSADEQSRQIILVHKIIRPN